MTPPRKISVVSATMEFPLCPTIISGQTAEGSTVYCRYRFGRLSIRIEHRKPAPSDGAEGRRIYERKIDPNGLDGQLSYDDLRKITEGWIEWPDELTPRKIDDGDVIDL